MPVNWLNGWRIKILKLAHNYLSNIEDGALNGTDCVFSSIVRQDLLTRRVSRRHVSGFGVQPEKTEPEWNRFGK